MLSVPQGFRDKTPLRYFAAAARPTLSDVSQMKKDDVTASNLYTSASFKSDCDASNILLSIAATFFCLALYRR